jgi:hypothetical protein
VAAIGLLLTIGWLLWNQPSDSLSTPENRPDPLTDYEKRVARYIKREAEGRPVKFLRWGPHLSGRKLEALWRETNYHPKRYSKTKMYAIRQLKDPKDSRAVAWGPESTLALIRVVHDEDGIKIDCVYAVNRGWTVGTSVWEFLDKGGDDWEAPASDLLQPAN